VDTCVHPKEMGEVVNEYFSVFSMEKDMETWEFAKVSGDIL